MLRITHKSLAPQIRLFPSRLMNKAFPEDDRAMLANISSVSKCVCYSQGNSEDTTLKTGGAVSDVWTYFSNLFGTQFLEHFEAGHGHGYGNDTIRTS